MLIKSNGKQVKGLCFSGKAFLTNLPELKIERSIAFNTAVEPSAGAEQTSGYAVTFSFSTNQFNLYKCTDINTPLDFLPTYKIVLYFVNETIIDTLSLVYDGNNLFHLEGSLSVSNVWDTSKLAGTGGYEIAMVDENNQLFVSSISLFSASISSTQTTVNYVSGTLTRSGNIEHKETRVEKISLPYSMPNTNVGSMESRYVCGSGTSSGLSFTDHYYIE